MEPVEINSQSIGTHSENGLDGKRVEQFINHTQANKLHDDMEYDEKHKKPQKSPKNLKILSGVRTYADISDAAIGEKFSPLIPLRTCTVTVQNEGTTSSTLSLISI